MVSREDNFIRYKAYGDESKPPLVIVPGLDGVTAFFADVLPELTLNVSEAVVVDAVAFSHLRPYFRKDDIRRGNLQVRDYG